MVISTVGHHWSQNQLRATASDSKCLDAYKDYTGNWYESRCFALGRDSSAIYECQMGMIWSLKSWSRSYWIRWVTISCQPRWIGSFLCVRQQTGQSWQHRKEQVYIIFQKERHSGAGIYSLERKMVWKPKVHLNGRWATTFHEIQTPFKMGESFEFSKRKLN